MCQKIQLFILPFSGAKAKQFSKVCVELEEMVKVETIEYAGRGSRAREPFFTDYILFENDIKKYIMDHRDYSLPYALLGYSIGGLFAYDLLAKGYIEEEPTHLFICACEDNMKKMLSISALPEDEFWNLIIDLGGVDKRLIANRKFLKLFSRTLRADFYIAEQHSYMDTDKLITCPVSVLYSEADTPLSNVESWQRVCKNKIAFIEFEGDHFFALEKPEAFASVISEQLGLS